MTEDRVDFTGLERSVGAICAEVDRLREVNVALVAALKGMRDTMAAMLRVVAMHESCIAQEFGAEIARIGIAKGFGVRADAAIAKAEGR